MTSGACLFSPLGRARWSPAARVQRGSSETARCTSIGDRLVCPLLLHRHLHRNRLQRVVEFVAGGGNDLVYYFHASKDFAEDGVGSVQPAVVRDTDIELRATHAAPRPWRRRLGSKTARSFLRS